MRCADTALGVLLLLGCGNASAPESGENQAHGGSSASGGASGSGARAGSSPGGGGSTASGKAGSGSGGQAGSGKAGSGGKASTGGDGGSGAVSSAGANGEAGTEAGGSGAVSGGGSNALGAYPFTPSTVTRGGTMTFTNVGAPGSWPRRLDREAGDPACSYKDGTDTWGGHCCMEEHATTSDELAPFDQEMTLILKAIDVKQLAIYQPASDAAGAGWDRVTSFDDRTGRSDNLWFTQEGDGSSDFPGDLTETDCVGYVAQAPLADCDEGAYFCPDDPGVLHRGFSGSKLVVFLASMAFDDSRVAACNGEGAGKPSPWVAFVASELIRDGGRKWNGLCNCYSKTGTVGDGCGEINVFEVVMDDNQYSNREFASTGVRSFQEGHVGGAVCQASCERDTFPDDVDVVDACAQTAYDTGPEIAFGGDTDGCPVWRRPDGDRYFFILLDQAERAIQVGIIHPARIPASVSGVLPAVTERIDRAEIDALLGLRLPAGND